MISKKNIDHGASFDWGRTSADYARWRDIYPQEFFDKILSLGLCCNGQRVLEASTGFYRTDRFKIEGEIHSVTWSTQLNGANCREDIGECGMTIEPGAGAPWPYSVDEKSLGEMFAGDSDADEFLDSLSRALAEMEMDFTAWDLVGISAN